MKLENLTPGPWLEIDNASDEGIGTVRIQVADGRWRDATPADLAAMRAAPELVEVARLLVRGGDLQAAIDAARVALGKLEGASADAAAPEATIKDSLMVGPGLESSRWRLRQTFSVAGACTRWVIWVEREEGGTVLTMPSILVRDDSAADMARLDELRRRGEEIVRAHNERRAAQ